jgi:hypothetical protein
MECHNQLLSVKTSEDKKDLVLSHIPSAHSEVIQLASQILLPELQRFLYEE